MSLTAASRVRPRSAGARSVSARTRVGWIASALVIAAWVVFLRPQAVGGPAAFVMVTGDSMEPSLSAGDLVVAMEREAYAIGDVVVYRVPQEDAAAGQLVIHRIVEAPDGGGYVVRGDNRAAPDLWRPRPEEVVGQLQFVLPGGARVVEWLRHPGVVASLATVLWLTFVLRRQSAGDESTRLP